LRSARIDSICAASSEPLSVEGTAVFGQNPETWIVNLSLFDLADEGSGGPCPLREPVLGQPALLAKRLERLPGAQHPSGVRPRARSSYRLSVVPYPF
jgi:hypothetical protein